jgi:hypothetical protein
VATTTEITTLSDQFEGALARLELGDKRKRVEASHTEIRALLESDPQLCAWGVDTILIGSYARKTAIYPGKDVDVFTKLTKLTTESANPKMVFEAVRDVLVKEYGDRAEPQERSIKVTFPIDGEEDFHVDVVPAVRDGSRWAIPRHDTRQWDAQDVRERWVETDPEEFGRLTTEQNKSSKVNGQGAYVPTVKLVRQIRRHHRGKTKPGGFYFELLAYWAFEAGATGDSFAEILANTLAAIAAQLNGPDELIDPVLGKPYKPAPDPADRASAAALVAELAADAQRALYLDKCPAAVIWRRILGEIDDLGPIFEIPPGCDAEGRALPAVAVRSTGSEEAKRFASDPDNRSRLPRAVPARTDRGGVQAGRSTRPPDVGGADRARADGIDQRLEDAHRVYGRLAVPPPSDPGRRHLGRSHQRRRRSLPLGVQHPRSDVADAEGHPRPCRGMGRRCLRRLP